MVSVTHYLIINRVGSAICCYRKLARVFGIGGKPVKYPSAIRRNRTGLYKRLRVAVINEVLHSLGHSLVRSRRFVYYDRDFKLTVYILVVITAVCHILDDIRSGFACLGKLYGICKRATLYFIHNGSVRSRTCGYKNLLVTVIFETGISYRKLSKALRCFSNLYVYVSVTVVRSVVGVESISVINSVLTCIGSHGNVRGIIRITLELILHSNVRTENFNVTRIDKLLG